MGGHYSSLSSHCLDIIAQNSRITKYPALNNSFNKTQTVMGRKSAAHIGRQIVGNVLRLPFCYKGKLSCYKRADMAKIIPA